MRSASILERWDETIGFSHHLIQDYFVALYFQRLGLSGTLSLQGPPADRFRPNTRWYNAIRMYYGITSEPDSLLKELMGIDIELAVDCIFMGRNINKRMVEDFLTTLHGEHRKARSEKASCEKQVDDMDSTWEIQDLLDFHFIYNHFYDQISSMERRAEFLHSMIERVTAWLSQ
ncbi:MAG: hypothetical protein KJ065_25865 [Anaerolineae bacterium]|nr:hypothetical protein [Anaerolineae bacterium]